jgi:L-fuconolactonase
LMSGLVIDAQVHVWRSVANSAGRHRDTPLRGEELVGIMDAAGVDRAILIPPAFAGDRNEECLRSARVFPARFGVMGNLPLDQRNAFGLISSWRAIPGMLGIRISFHLESHRNLLLEGSLERLWQLAAEHRVPVMIYPVNVLDRIRSIAARHPHLRLVIDHLGALPMGKTRALADGVDAVGELADLPNVAVKASCLPYYSQEGFPFTDVHTALCRALAKFGPDRVFWGTDFTRLRCSYVDAVRMVDHVSCLHGNAKRQVRGEAIRAWLDWE